MFERKRSLFKLRPFRKTTFEQLRWDLELKREVTWVRNVIQNWQTSGKSSGLAGVVKTAFYVSGGTLWDGKNYEILVLWGINFQRGCQNCILRVEQRSQNSQIIGAMRLHTEEMTFLSQSSTSEKILTKPRLPTGYFAFSKLGTKC